MHRTGSAWPPGDGEMVALIRQHDWAATPLGPLEQWPASLKVAAELVLSAGFPMVALWGPDLVQVYNDGYRELMGVKHPAGLGQPTRECWPEVWHINAPIYARVLAGETVRIEEGLYPITRSGVLEDAWFTLAYSPLRDDAGAIAGVLVTVIETSERARALRDSEAQHRLLLGSWAQAVWETDAEGVVVADSPSWRAYTGQTLDEWLGYGWLDAIHPDDREYAERQWREAMAARSLVNAEFRLRSPDGGHRWTNVRAAPVLDAAGGIEKWAGMNIDIDARKRAEEALRQSEERYRTLFETIDEGFCVLELVQQDGEVVDYRLIEVNAAFEAQSGLVNATGKLRTELAPGDEDPWLATYDEVARTGEAQRFERYHQPTGRWYDVFVRRVEGADPPRMAVVFNDITLRKQAQAEARESEERQAFLLKLSDALGPLADPVAIQGEAARLLGEQVKADRTYYSEMNEAERVAVVAIDYVRGDAPSLVGRHPYDFYAPIVEDARAGKLVAEPDIAAASRFSEADLEAIKALGIGSYLSVPLLKAGRLVAILTVSDVRPRHWTDAEIAFVRETAERTWSAVERARAEAALRESEEVRSTMMNVVPVGLGLGDPEGKIILSNPEWDRFIPTGRIPSRDPERGSRWRTWDAKGNLVPSDRYPDARALCGEHVTSPMEFLYTDDDGRELWTSIAAVPLRDQRGRVTGTVSIIQNIDATKRAEQARRESEERLRGFGASQDVLWIREAETLQWTYLTAAFETIYGISRDKALSGNNFRNWLDLILPDDRHRAIEMIRRVREGEHLTFEYRIKRPGDGAIRWLRNTDFPITDETGGIKLIGGIGKDVTDEKRDEERLKTLLAELQHRVRNILAVVRSVFTRTVETGGDIESLAEHFRGRLDALARTQIVVTQNPQGSADLENLVREELLSVGVADGPSVSIEGPEVELSAEAAEALGLAVHELTTNSVKYGALSFPDATLAIRWSLNLNYSGVPCLAFIWEEQGVPTIPVRPVRRGFGTELITQALPYRVGAETSLEFRGGGVRCVIQFPFANAGSRSSPPVEAQLDGR